LPRRIALGVAIASILISSFWARPVSGHASRSVSLRSRPNIVLILTDDQRWDEVDAMPIVQSELIGKGLTFTNGLVVNSLCCPSRTTILTGKYSHGTDIYSNDPPHGGFDTFSADGEENSTIATWLQGAGYDTGLVGKYLNGYGIANASHVPPGWNTWDSLLVGDSTGGYYGYSMSINGTVASYGTSDADYSTDVLAGYADSFIRNAPGGTPLFLYFAPHAPHVPATPPTRYLNSFSDLQPLRPPNYNEADVSDKPLWVQQLPLLTTQEQNGIDSLRQNEYRTLLAVDDAVGTILTALTDTGRLSNTLIVFASDQGMELGSHRWEGKSVVWEEAIRIPLILRYDPLTKLTPQTNGDLALNLDFANTFAAAAGITAPGAVGRSLLRLVTNPAAKWRTSFLIEKAGSNGYCAVRTTQYKYVRYADHEEELYDLVADPFELDSKASDPNYAAIKSQLYQLVLNSCKPYPPGWTP
jgi:N-acetylglucosamine-6-sulfatase